MRYSRWIVPAAVAATVAGGVAVSSAAAGGAPELPDRTAAQVLAAVATSDVRSYSGTVSTRTDLGLPALPAGLTSGGSGGSEEGSGDGSGGRPSAADPRAVAVRLLTGDATLRVWADGPQRQRVQLLDAFSEVALVRDGRDLWAFDTGSNSGTHVVLPQPGERPGRTAAGDLPVPGSLEQATPQALAQQVIDLVDPTTQVALGAPATVAGRAAYRLVVTPRTDATLVDRAVLAVDAQTGMPLRVQVFARGHAQPAVDAGFDDLDLSRPAADRFTFTPPAGADVETLTVPAPDPATKARPDAPGTPDAGALPDVRTSGSGWAGIVEVAPGTGPDAVAGGPDAAALLSDPALQALTTPVDGGRAVSTRLFSALLTDDGRLLVGAVPVDALVRAAAGR